MHFVYILIGFFVGGSVGETSDSLLGALAGALFATLMFRHAVARSKIDSLSRRIENIEQRQASAIPARSQALASPEPQAIRTVEPPSAPLTGFKAPAETKYKPGADEPVVHPRAPEAAPDPGPLSHVLQVAKRWLTSGNVPVKVGVLISFIGIGFLLKYAIENTAFEIPIAFRYVGIAAFAAVLLSLGWRMRTRERVYALSLQGGGIGVLFLTVFAAFQLHALLPATLAFGILVLVTAATGVLAVRQESRALAILGTTGGFLAPLLVSTGSGDHVALFSYYLVLNCAVLGVAWLRTWRELNIIGFVFTFGVGTLWGFKYYVPELFVSTEPFLVLHFLFYTAIAVLFSLRQPKNSHGFVDATLLFGTPTIAFALQTQLLDTSEYGLAVSAALVAVFYAVLAVWLWRKQERSLDLLTQSLTALSVAFATIAIPLAIDDRWTAIAWALEGTALVWIGVRQNGTLARLSGAALAFAGGAAYIRHGWTHGLGLPILNGNYLGGTLIALSSIVSARLLVAYSKDFQWQRFVSVGLLGWGLLWWFATAYAEIFDRAPRKNELHSLLLFTTGSFALMAYAANHLHWTALKRTTLAFLPLLTVFFLFYLVDKDHLFDGLGWAAWMAAIATHVWILYVYGRDRNAVETLWHAGGAVFVTAALAYEMYWQVDRVVLNDVWPYSSGLLVIAAAAFAMVFERRKKQWPISDYFSAYFLASLTLAVGALLLITAASFEDPGDPSPLPYIPLLNPFDVISAASLAVAAYLIRIGAKDSRLDIVGQREALSVVWGAGAFVLSTLAVIRAVHHLAGVGWDRQTLMASVLVQTSLTIFWAGLGLTGMIMGTRRSNRRVWMLGVGLMVVVVAKLAVIDLGNTGTLARIVSFLGVGIMLLVVGYFSPVPPKTEAVESTA